MQFNTLYRYKGDDFMVGSVKLVRNRIYFLNHLDDCDTAHIMLSNGIAIAEYKYDNMKVFCSDWQYIGILGA